MITAQESITAKLCSFARAYHSTMGREKIFDDYLAYDIIGREEYAQLDGLLREAFSALPTRPRYGFENVWLFEELDRCFTPVTLSRLAFTEEALAAFVKKHGRVQYVICGAGMDTFAYRNTNPALTVFELDKAATQEFKKKRIKELSWQSVGEVHFVPVDFERGGVAEALLAAGFSPAEPAFFSLLGVTYYLPYDALSRLLMDVGKIASAGDQFAVDFPDETSASRNAPERMRELAAITESLGEPMQPGNTLEAVWQALHEAGFGIREHESPAGIQQRFFKKRAGHQSAFENIHFVLAQKEKNKKYMY